MMKLTVVALLMLMSISSFSFERKAVELRLYMNSTFKNSGQTINSRIEELDKIQSDIDIELEKNKFDSELLFLKGMVVRQYAYTIEDPLTKHDLETLKSIGKESDSWLLRAIENNIDDLSVSQLYIISKSSMELAIKTIDKILEKDERLEGEENRVVELKRQRIDNLIRLGRFDEARDEMVETNQEHPTFKSAEWDEAFEGQIAEVQAKLQENQEKEIKTQTAKKANDKPVVSKEIKDDIAVEKKDNAKESNSISNEPSEVIEVDPRIKLYGSFALGFLVLLGLYLFSNRKRKK